MEKIVQKKMASTSNSAHVLMKKGKRGAAAYIHAECSGANTPQHLNELLDLLLNPGKAIDEFETIDWCKWLMAGGKTPDEFSSIVRTYDNATTCGLVWTPNIVAYRCRTCGISPCMSLCADCFKKGNHKCHDYNMFVSQAGGACDCGDTSVMQATGFCERHGPGRSNTNQAPTNLMCIAQAMMPRIILRLIQHLRENSGFFCKSGTRESYHVAIQDADNYLKMLLDFNGMGGLMRKVLTGALTNPQIYKNLLEVPEDRESEYAQYMLESNKAYADAVQSLPSPEPPDEYKDCASLQEQLVHKTFLEELVFWTVKFEFPQIVVCLLLNMLPDPDYKEALTRAFVLHYSRISIMLEQSKDPDTLSNRVVHVSVQLFSNQSLALRMSENLHLLHVMVISLKYMMSKILMQNTMHDPDKNFHYVVDCNVRVMKEHCYWPLVSDLNNVLSHRPVAMKFMMDETLVDMWFAFLSMFQGMNVNQRETNEHVKFEPNTYFAAFSAELEASAYPMWALVSHLTDTTSVEHTKRVLNSCVVALQDWLDAIYFTNPSIPDSGRMSFHLPLHRYFAVFVSQAVKMQGVALHEVLPAPDVLHLIMMHPLRVQVAFYEILAGLWVRNGAQIKGQAMTYIHYNFCNSMVDADMYLLQICCTHIEPSVFINTLIEKFNIMDWLSLACYREKSYLVTEFDQPLLTMVESCLTFLATLINGRTNLGLSDSELNRLEMVTLLCMGNKTHSQLMELIPERCGSSQHRDFEQLLAEVADYKQPNLDATGPMGQGMYAPKGEVWESLYDPLHVLLRAVERRDYSTSLEKFTQYCLQAGYLKGNQTAWPPYRIPAACHQAYEDPRKVLRTRLFHSMVFTMLYKAVNGNASEHYMALVIYLLEMAVDTADKPGETACQPSGQNSSPLVVHDRELANWFPTDNLAENLRTVIGQIELPPETKVSTSNYSSDSSDSEWGTTSDTETEIMPELVSTPSSALMLEQSDGSSSLHDNALAIPSPNAVALNPDMSVVPEQSITHLEADHEMIDDDSPTILALPPIEGNELAVALPGDLSIAPLELAHQYPNGQAALMPPSSGMEVAIPETSTVQKRLKNRQSQEALPAKVELSESIISLLLKLHSQLSNKPDSYNLDDMEASSSNGNAYSRRIGDGPYFIGNLLNKIAAFDPVCRDYIKDTRLKLWPQVTESEDELRQQEEREREERRHKAQERQRRLIEEFASKQKEFMRNVMDSEEVGMDWQSDEDAKIAKKKEYDCVICNITTPSSEESPIGLVTLIQSTSVIAHCRRQPERIVLPTSEEERQNLRREDTLPNDYERRYAELARNFDGQSWLLSVNLGWEGGIHVQTCGHHLHLTCLKSYMTSLRNQSPKPTNLASDRGEYLCPLCRQLANSVLPIAPQLDECTQIVKSQSGGMHTQIADVMRMLKERNTALKPSNLSEAIGRAMEDMTNGTFAKFKQKLMNPMNQCLFLFVTSIARTNIEIELIQRGSSLVSLSSAAGTGGGGRIRSALMPKRDCIVPLLHVLSVHTKVLASWPTWKPWEQLTGLKDSGDTTTALAPVEREVPLLLRDPVALLIHYMLLLPLRLDHYYFTCVVKVLYNLLYYQVLAQLTCNMSSSEREYILYLKQNGDYSNTMVDSLADVIEVLGQSELYIDECVATTSQGSKSKISINALEQQVQRLCLPFLRAASLFRHHLYEQSLPEIRSPHLEFVRLVYFLELVTEGMDWECFNAGVALNWPSENNPTASTDIPRLWCDQYVAFVLRGQIAARSFLVDLHCTWYPPRLLSLPKEYDKIFSFYHERQCSQCHSVPQETSICLMCGTVVCLKQACCKQQNVCEAVQHSIDCGGGTGIFLVVTTTYVIIIRGRRACLWGSLYLDDFEEEDRDLKRGKPLYLSEDRFQLLEQQWIAHRFDHTKKTWVWHRDAL